ncbi:MAG: PaeR7I family type II restriction endonuclease [Candidatus Sulfotelmatobacter sp.]
MALNRDLEKGLRRAIKHFWTTRETQAQKQGSTTGSRDSGDRAAVTGGRQMDGFISLLRYHLCNSGLPKAHVYCEKRIELPGWFRPSRPRVRGSVT